MLIKLDNPDMPLWVVIGCIWCIWYHNTIKYGPSTDKDTS